MKNPCYTCIYKRTCGDNRYGHACEGHKTRVEYNKELKAQAKERNNNDESTRSPESRN